MRQTSTNLVTTFKIGRKSHFLWCAKIVSLLLDAQWVDRVRLKLPELPVVALRRLF